MAQEKNMFLRVLVPVVCVCAVIGVGFAVLTNTGKQKAPAPPTQVATTAAPASPPSPPPAEGIAGSAGPGEVPSASAQPRLSEPAAAPPAPTGTFSARLWPAAEAGVALIPLGDLRGSKATAAGAAAAPTMLLEFSHIGAGLASLRLADHFDSTGKDRKHEILQQIERQEVPLADGTTIERTLVPMALLGVEIDGAFVNLATAASDGQSQVWKQVAPGSFEAHIIDASGATIGIIKRTYTLETGLYDVILTQTFENASGRALTLRWHQLGPVDLPIGIIRYGGDVRRVRLGYLPPRATDPDQQFVRGDTRFLLAHAAVLGEPAFDAGRNEFAFGPHAIWPDAAAVTEGLSLSWAAFTNRYFAVAVHPVPARQAPRTDTPAGSVLDKRFHLAAQLDRVVLSTAPAGADKAQTLATAVMALKLTSPPTPVAAGATADASLAFYAGPNAKKYLAASEVQEQMGLPELLVFTFGGPCAFCTFQPIAHLLRWYMGLLHDYILFDWALGIIVLVFTVRTLLHPVTRWSQTSLARFSKQMGALAPKQAKIKEKYANDPAKMREEIGRLMKEEGINYAGALGCLPMFLQTPVWIALYAMIFFTFEFRHEGAFFGVFQALGHPTFLADLSEPDRLIPFGTSFQVPLVSTLMGPIDAFNIIPLILGVVFFIQQKYLTPPPTSALTPEQESQQRIMKVMTVVMFPLMMYNAPAALSLYFMTNSTLGIIESRWIRAGIEQADKDRALRGDTNTGRVGVRVKNGPGSPGRPGTQQPQGFMARLRTMMEAKQREIERQRLDKARREGKK
ncbi:MAG: membrane protein insertase YidC [Phycisphaerales bacterium]